jgi:hypothetical protein
LEPFIVQEVVLSFTWHSPNPPAALGERPAFCSNRIMMQPLSRHEHEPPKLRDSETPLKLQARYRPENRAPHTLLDQWISGRATQSKSLILQGLVKSASTDQVPDQWNSGWNSDKSWQIVIQPGNLIDLLSIVAGVRMVLICARMMFGKCS